MSRPLEYDARARVRGFSILEEDFDFMLVDLCCDTREETNRDETGKSLVKKPWRMPGSVGRALWSMGKGLFPKRA